MTDSHIWTYRIARPHRRVWIQSTERFSSPHDAAIALGIYLAMTPEESGAFVGEVVIATEEMSQ